MVGGMNLPPTKKTSVKINYAAISLVVFNKSLSNLATLLTQGFFFQPCRWILANWCKKKHWKNHETVHWVEQNNHLKQWKETWIFFQHYFILILMQVIQTFGAFRLTLFPLWPGLASFPSCLGRRVPVRLQIRPDLITMANQNVLSHILFEGWTENNTPWYFASCAVFFWMDLTKGLASHADDLRALSCVSVPKDICGNEWLQT